MAGSAEDGGQELIRLTKRQLDQAALVLAHGFHNHPLTTFFFPDDGRRERVLPDLWRSVVRYTMFYGEVWASSGLSGVACWLPPGQTHKALGRMLRAGMWKLLFRLRRDELARNLANDGYADRLHARYAPGPHWYLFAIAVEPRCQGRGIGSSLLRPMLARMDNERMPVYLETHTLQNVTFYKKHHFNVVGEGQVSGSSVPLFAMLRRPAPIAGEQHRCLAMRGMSNLFLFATSIPTWRVCDAAL